MTFEKIDRESEKIDRGNYMDSNKDVRSIHDYLEGDLSRVVDSQSRANRILAAKQRYELEAEIDRLVELESRGVSIELGERAAALSGAGAYIEDMRKARGFRSAVDVDESGLVKRYGRYKAEEMSDRLSDKADANRFKLDEAADYLAATDDLLEIGFSNDELADSYATELGIKKSLLASLDVKSTERNKKLKATRQAAGLEPINKKRNK